MATTALVAVVAVVLGTAVGTARTFHSPIARALGRRYVEIFRTIPLIVQLFLWFFVLPELLPAHASR